MDFFIWNSTLESYRLQNTWQVITIYQQSDSFGLFKSAAKAEQTTDQIYYVDICCE